MENREFYIKCDGVNIHAKMDFPKTKQEKYPILVIIPGLTGHIEERHIIATAEAANEIGFVTLRSELYGHGKSEGEFRNHNVLIWMTEAMRVIDYVKKLDFVSDIYLAGHSQGGLTTILAGGMMSDSIKALIPMSPATVIKYGAIEGKFLGQNFEKDKIPEILHLRDDFYITGDYVRAARVLPLDECIAAFRKPVLIVHGTQDEAVPYELAQKLVTQYENAKLVTIPDDNHCYDLHLELATEAVKDFLKEQMSK